MPDEKPPLMATPKTVWLPLGVAGTLILAVSGGAVSLNSQLLAINYSIRTVEARIEALNGSLDSRVRQVETRMEADNTQLRTELRSWVNLFRARNEAMPIPTFPVGD